MPGSSRQPSAVFPARDEKFSADAAELLFYRNKAEDAAQVSAIDACVQGVCLEKEV